MLEGWFGCLLWHYYYTIYNIFIDFIIAINKRTSVFILTIAPDFTKDFTCSFFRF